MILSVQLKKRRLWPVIVAGCIVLALIFTKSNR